MLVGTQERSTVVEELDEASKRALSPVLSTGDELDDDEDDDDLTEDEHVFEPDDEFDEEPTAEESER